MKNLWLRVGITLSLTDAEAEHIIGPSGYNKMEDTIRKVFDEGRYELDGNTYVPGVVIEDFNASYGTAYPEWDRECDL